MEMFKMLNFPFDFLYVMLFGFVLPCSDTSGTKYKNIMHINAMMWTTNLVVFLQIEIFNIATALHSYWGLNSYILYLFAVFPFFSYFYYWEKNLIKK